MTIDDLREYKRLKDNVLFLENKLYNVKAITYDNTTSRTNNPTNDSNSRLLELIEKKAELQIQMEDIEIFIYTFFDEPYKTIIWDRFIEGMSFYSISLDINYSESQTRRFYKRAIEQLENQ